jgi:hypothetical protein
VISFLVERQVIDHDFVVDRIVPRHPNLLPLADVISGLIQIARMCVRITARVGDIVNRDEFRRDNRFRAIMFAFWDQIDSRFRSSSNAARCIGFSLATSDIYRNIVVLFAAQHVSTLIPEDETCGGSLHVSVDVVKAARYTLYGSHFERLGANSMFMFESCGSLVPRLIAGVFVVCLTTVGQAAEVAVLPTTLGFPPGSADTSTQSVFVQPVRSGSLKIDSVVVEYISGPDDTRLDTAAAKVVEFTPGASGTSVPIKLELTRLAFSRPGPYKIGLRLKGQRTPEAAPQQPQPAAPALFDELVELSLTRAAAQITINLPHNSRVTIDRGFPWNEGRLSISISVTQNAGPEVEGLKFNAGSILRSSDSDLVPGHIDLNPPELKVASGSGTGTLMFTNFKRAGDFKTDLTFVSPNLARPVSVPIAIRVKDNWVLPLLVILAGVFAGAAVHVLARIWRPHQLSAYRLAQLQTRLDALANAIGETRTRSEYERLLTRLYNLTEGIDIDVTTDQAVQQLETDIAALQDKLAKVEAEANDALKQLRDSLEKARTDLAPYEGSVVKELGDLENRVARCSELYATGRSEEALACIKAEKENLDRTRARLANKALDAMTKEIDGLPNDQKAQLLAKAQQAADDLKKPSADIGLILSVLRKAIDSTTKSTRDFASLTAAPLLQMTITVSAPPEARRAGAPLQFTITEAPRKDVKGVTWSFEGLRMPGNLSISRRFPVPGRYLVTAEVEYKNGGVDSTAPFRLVVLPSEAQSVAQRIRQNIRAADIGVLVLSVAVAAVSGLLDRYSDKAFGTVADYCWAFLWGFGIDSVVRGFGATFTRLTART